MPIIVHNTSINDVRRAWPKTIYYSVKTCWWTHRAEDLQTEPMFGLPTDPRGGVLMQTDDPEAFLRTAEAHPEAYGKHGLDAFIAAHNDNCLVSWDDQRQTCMETWQEYNDVLDDQKVVGSAQRSTANPGYWA